MRLVLPAAVLALSASQAGAATLTYSDLVTLTTTNWTDTASVAQFDPTLGVLNSVTFTLEGAVQGTHRAESLDGATASVTTSLGAQITAGHSVLGQLAVVFPTDTITRTLTAFDGTIDFAGDSGFVSDGSATDTDTNTMTNGLGQFIGIGSITFDVAATGTSSGSGAGNLITQFNTDASALISVVYDYTATPVASVPLPAGLPLLLTGLASLAYLRRRKAA